MIIQGSTHYINTWRKKEKQYVMATFLRKKISLPQPFFSLRKTAYTICLPGIMKKAGKKVLHTN